MSRNFASADVQQNNVEQMRNATIPFNNNEIAAFINQMFSIFCERPVTDWIESSMSLLPSSVLPEVLVSLLLHLRWNETLVLVDNDTVSESVLHKLHEGSILTSVVQTSFAQKYPWPSTRSISRQYDGFLLLTTSACRLDSLVPTLKTKPTDVIVPRFSWIIASDSPIPLHCLQQVLSEGDKVAVVTMEMKANHHSRQTMIRGGEKDFCSEKEFCHLPQEKISSPENGPHRFDVWSLFSMGDGTTEFKKRGHWTRDAGLRLLGDEIFFPTFYNFRNRVLKISALGSPPVKEPPLRNETKWRGYMFHIINTLGDLLNFTYTVKEADDRLYGIAQEDGSWSGMIGELTRKTVDIGVGDLSWSPDRSSVVDFTEPVFPETVTFIYRAPGFYSRAWILFESYDLKIWISIFLSATIVGATFFVTLAHEQFVLHHEHDAEGAAIKTVSYFYRTLVGQGSTALPKTVSSRALLATWFLGCLILNALYGGTLTSRLSMHKSPKPANSLAELMKRYPEALLAVRNNSLPHAYFKESPVNEMLWQNNIRYHIIPGKVKMEQTLEEVRNSSEMYVWIAERSMLEKKMRELSTNKDICDFYVAKEEIVRSDWALALTLDSPFLEQFNNKIVRMRNFGLIDLWRNRHWHQKNATCRPTDGLNQLDRTPISLSDTLALFMMLLLGHIVGFAMLVGELLCQRMSVVRGRKVRRWRIKPHSN